jgi:hypothetical protein
LQQQPTEDPMTRKLLILMASASLMAGALAAPASAARCIKAGGWGTGVTEGVARFMAEAALKNQAKAWGGEAVKIGAVAQSCKLALGFECTATARACK